LAGDDDADDAVIGVPVLPRACLSVLARATASPWGGITVPLAGHGDIQLLGLLPWPEKWR